jgi:serine protease Do
VTSNVARELLIEQRSMWSGLEGVVLTGALAQIFNIPPPEIGLLVQRVARGSPADRLGIRAGSVHATIADEELLLGGDIVLSFQGVRLEGAESFAQFRELGAQLKRGEMIRVTVLRGGRTMELTAPVEP